MSDVLQVVAAIIVDEDTGRILLTQRVPEKHYGWTWECPGGAVESGETFGVALRRELKEELALQVEVASDPVYVARLRTRDLGIMRSADVTFYQCSVKGFWVFDDDASGKGNTEYLVSGVNMGQLWNRPRMQKGQQVGMGWFNFHTMTMIRSALAPANQELLATLMSNTYQRKRVFGV